MSQTLITELQSDSWRQLERTPFSDAAIKIGNMFKSEDARQLPSYKDKPYNHSSIPSTTKTKRPIYRRRRVLLLVTVVMGLIFWIMFAMRTETGVAGTGSFQGKHQAIDRANGVEDNEVEMEIVSGGQVPKGKRPKLMRQGGKAWIELPDGTRQKLDAKGKGMVGEPKGTETPVVGEEPTEMELVSGGEVPKGVRPKLMREGGRAWVQMPDGTKQDLAGKRSP